MNTGILIGIVMALILIMSLLVVFFILYWVALSPAAQKRNKLYQQARLDYRTARGGAHLKLMLDAYERLSRSHKECQSALDKANRHRSDVEARRDRELRTALETHIVQTRLREIPGVGQILAEQLRQHVQNHGGLDSLRKASQDVPGIGPSRQASIDHWVASQKAQMSAMLMADFPGKATIVQKAEAELAGANAEINKKTAELAALATRRDRLKAESAPLKQVAPADLYQALQNPEIAPKNVELYLRGIFAEWEPMPDWFKEIMEGAPL